MSAIYLYDDARARRFEPFALTRPMAELRAGALLIRERWATALGLDVAGSITASHLEAFQELGAAPVHTGDLAVGDVVVNARCAPALAAIMEGFSVVRVGGRVGAVRLDRPITAAALADGTLDLEAVAPTSGWVDGDGVWLDEVWDLISTIGTLLAQDIAAIALSRGLAPSAPEGCAVLGADVAAGRALFLEDGAIVEPFVTIDLSGGPVYLERGATLQSFSRLAGPCFIGRDSIVGSDRIGALIVGDTCRVHGEVSNTVFLGHCNKGHDGFVGHSYLGRWVNLGANTVTSNLKNTYGSVDLWTPEGVRSTGQQFLGTMFGDHAKTGIGLKLTTGSVIGAGAQVYGLQMPPKVVPPFAWGDKPPYQAYRLDKFLEVAERVLSRRHVELTADARRQLEASYARAADEGYASQWQVRK